MALNGRVVGGWRRTVEKGESVLATDLLVPLSRKGRALLRDAADGHGRFMELPARIARR